MYKINQTTITDELNNKHIMYGIECENNYYTELSSDKSKIEKLCELINKLNVSTTELPYILDDFLNS